MWFPFKKIQIAPVATIAEIEIFLSQRCLSLLSLPSLLSLNSVFPYIATVAETRFSTTVAIVATGAIIWKPGLKLSEKRRPSRSAGFGMCHIQSVRYSLITNTKEGNIKEVELRRVNNGSAIRTETYATFQIVTPIIDL